MSKREQISNELIEELKEIKKVIKREIFNEVRNEMLSFEQSLKEEIKKEIKREVVQMREQIRAEMESTRGEISAAKEEISTAKNEISNIKGELTHSRGGELVPQQKAAVKELVVAASKQIYDKISSDIATKIVPRIDNLTKWVQYTSEDGQELVTEYRRAVERQMRNDDRKMITGGGRGSKSWADGNVSLFFDDDTRNI